MSGCQLRHSIPTIQRCYARFLEGSSNPDDREYSEAAGPNASTASRKPLRSAWKSKTPVTSHRNAWACSASRSRYEPASARNGAAGSQGAPESWIRPDSHQGQSPLCAPSGWPCNRRSDSRARDTRPGACSIKSSRTPKLNVAISTSSYEQIAASLSMPAESGRVHPNLATNRPGLADENGSRI